MNFRRLHYYHLQIQTNSRNDFFIRDSSDFAVLINKYLVYTAPFFKTLCYNFSPQRYESIVFVKDTRKIVHQNLNPELALTDILSNCIRRFHIAYCRYFNFRYNRKGSLFREKPKAAELKSFAEVINHLRRVHQLTRKQVYDTYLEDRDCSSYSSYVENKDDPALWKERVMEYFGSVEEFIEFHRDYR